MKAIISFLVLSLATSNISNAQFISNDGELHVIAGAAISAATYTIVYSTTKNKKKAFWYGLGASTLAGIVKEAIDSRKEYNSFDAGDLAATSLGGLTASTTLSLFVGNKKKNKMAKKGIALVN